MSANSSRYTLTTAPLLFRNPQTSRSDTLERHLLSPKRSLSTSKFPTLGEPLLMTDQNPAQMNKN